MPGVHLAMFRPDPETGDVVVNVESTGGGYAVAPLRPRGARSPSAGHALVVGDNISGSVLFLGADSHVLTPQQRAILSNRLGVTLQDGVTAGQAIVEVLKQGEPVNGPGAKWPRMPANSGDGWIVRLGGLVVEAAP